MGIGDWFNGLFASPSAAQTAAAAATFYRREFRALLEENVRLHERIHELTVGAQGTIANYTSLSTYSTDAATIRNNFYRIAEWTNAYQGAQERVADDAYALAEVQARVETLEHMRTRATELAERLMSKLATEHNYLLLELIEILRA